jgi:hypothetical protein
MRKFLIAAAAMSGLVLGGVSLQAKDKEEEGVSGILIDNKCGHKDGKAKSEEDAAKHPADCVLKCAATGIGVAHDGKWIKLDEKGQKLAKEYLDKHKDDKNATHVHVAGKVNDAGDEIAVEEIHPKKEEKEKN